MGSGHGFVGKKEVECQPWDRDNYVVEESGGMKDDSDKLRYDLLPPGPIRQLAEIITFGSIKYADNNWQKVDQKRYIAAMMRHIEAWREGESHDADSGKHHLAHAMCNVMFMLWQETNEPKDRTYIDGSKTKGQPCYGNMDHLEGEGRKFTRKPDLNDGTWMNRSEG